MSIRLRPATLADVALLSQWDEDPGVLSGVPHEGRDWSADLAEIPSWRDPLIAEEDGRPVGFVDLMDPHRDTERYWGDAPPGLIALDIWIGAAEDRSRGLGGEIMRQAIARSFASTEVTAIVIDPLATNVRAIRFYERLGFLSVERRMFGDDDCLVMRLGR